MAWGYWTAYSTSYAGHSRRQRALSPPNKRDRSLERERDRISLAAAITPDCVSRTSVTYVSGSGTGSGRDNEGGIMASAVRNHPGVGKHIPPHHLQANHVEPEKVAYERRLLLGDPDWANRTLADRNTLPRKKQPEYDKSSGSEALYSGGEGSSEQPPRTGVGDSILRDNVRHSPATTPLDSGSHKSDEIFCPACAHQSSQAASSSRGDINSNRDSRVSFGSVASSSRGSRGSGSGRGGGGGFGNQHRGVPVLRVGEPMGSESIPLSIPSPPHPSSSSLSTQHHPSMRARSRSQDDDDRCSSQGGLSSSLPTPPPPPTYSSHRDILSSSNNVGHGDERIANSSQSVGHSTAAALMETINKKMAFLSKFKPTQQPHQSYSDSSKAAYTTNHYHRESQISPPKYHTMSGMIGDGHVRESQNYYQHSNVAAGPSSHNFRQHFEESSQQQPSGMLIQAATAAASLNHNPASTSSLRSTQKSSNTSSIEKAAGSSASRDHSSSSLHSLRGPGNGLGDMQSMNSVAVAMPSVDGKPALPPKPQTTAHDSIASHQCSGDCDISRDRNYHHLSRTTGIGTVDKRRNQPQSHHQKDCDAQYSLHYSHNYPHQRSYSAGRRSAHSHSRSGSRTPRGSSSRTSRESLGKASRESLSNGRERCSTGTGHSDMKYQRSRGRRGSNEPLEDADADGDEESEGGNTHTNGLMSGSRIVTKNSNKMIHSEHRVRVTHHHQQSLTHHNVEAGSSSSYGRSSKESGSIVGIRNRKSSSFDEMTCGDATIHRGEYEDDLINPNLPSVKRRKSHGGAYNAHSSDNKERISNDGDNENEVEDEEEDEDEDNRGTMRRRRIRTTSASDHSEVSGTHTSSYIPPPDGKSSSRDRLSSGERGDADDDDDDEHQKDNTVNKKTLVSAPQNTSYNTTKNRSQRSSQSQTPDEDNANCGINDISVNKKDIQEGYNLDKRQHSTYSQEEKRKLEEKEDASLRSVSECEERTHEYNTTLKGKSRKGSLSNNNNNDRFAKEILESGHVGSVEGNAQKLQEIPFTSSPPSFYRSSIPNQDFRNTTFSFGRQPAPTQVQTQSQINPQTSMSVSKGNVQYFKHYDHREQHQDPSETKSIDQCYPYLSSQSKNQQSSDFKTLTSTTTISGRDFSRHTARRSGERPYYMDPRRRSASIGDRLSDVDNIDDECGIHGTVRRNGIRDRGNRGQDRSTYRDDSVGNRKSHTLDDRRTRRGNDCSRRCTLPCQPMHQPSHNHQMSSMGSFQNLAPPNSGGAYAPSSTGFGNTKVIYHHHQPSANSSTKSEKSSSRSSHSPSIDSNKYGKK